MLSTPRSRPARGSSPWRGGDRLAGTPWRGLADALSSAAGPFPRALVRAWRAELDAAHACVREKEHGLFASQAREEHGADGGADGVHALLALAGARAGGDFDRSQLIGVAAAAELAFLATRHHDAVADEPRQDGGARRNTAEILGGDWAITQAAMLTADISPAAYRLLVRGYGAAQLERLDPARPPTRLALLPTALALGALVAGAPEAECVLGLEQAPLAGVLQWARSRVLGTPAKPITTAAR